eukprot:PhF_6_TR3370/c0_g1_i1/m.4802/K13431/SRPR; signal recognition particle receptor subunit alpha
MIDEVSVVSQGGLLLWKKSLNPVRGNPVNQLIKNVILEERVSEESFLVGDYRLWYLLVNEFELIFVVIIQKFLSLLCAKQLLSELRDDFVKMFEEQLKSGAIKLRPNMVSTQFDALFELRYEKLRKEEQALRRTVPRAINQSSNEDMKVEESEGSLVTDASLTTSGSTSIGSSTNKPTIAARIAGTGRGSFKKPEPKAAAEDTKIPRKKSGRTWGDKPDDYVPPVDEPEGGGAATRMPDVSHLIRKDENGNVAPVQLEKWDDPPAPPTTAAAKPDDQKRGRFANFLRSRFGDRELDTQDLEALLPALREKLIAKNVAVTVADKLMTSVHTSLEGKKLGRFDVLHKVVEEALVSSLQRILTPKKEINILREAARCRDELMRPYIICFCGVNGVGKSTSLSKIAFLLKQNGFSVLVAACDTFRGGAVEQLQVHCNAIDIPLHAQGYGQDASQVATNAIARAVRERLNVVLIDTAGRMQEHEARMTALAKLVHENKPDLTLFVGEALVGNDGAHQLEKFNEWFMKLTPPGGVPRGIDGIFLTKFDTIDDMVGAAVSMVYQCGQPIIFAGVGQTYQDLKRLNPEIVARTLLA